MSNSTASKRHLTHNVIRTAIGLLFLAISGSQELIAQTTARFTASATIVATPDVMAAQKVTENPATRAFLEAQSGLVSQAQSAGQQVQTVVGPAVVTVRMADHEVSWMDETGAAISGPWAALPSVSAPTDVQVLVEFSGN